MSYTGLVQRAPGKDGRTRALACTRDGDEQATRLLDRRQTALEELLGGLPNDEYAALEPLLARIAETLAQDRPAALRVCRLCDRDSCEAHGDEVCPLDHTTAPPREGDVDYARPAQRRQREQRKARQRGKAAEAADNRRRAEQQRVWDRLRNARAAREASGATDRGDQPDRDDTD